MISDEIALVLSELKKTHVEDVLLPVLMQLLVIIIAARIFGWLAVKLRQPQAVGEIAAGLLLGPSLLGRLVPSVHAALFHPQVGEVLTRPFFDITFHWIFTILSQIGLVLLLFLIGLEFDFSHLKLKGRAAAMISVSGIVLPFILGTGLAYLIYPLVGAENLNFIGFALFMGTAMSITALPILGRIMIELGFSTSRLGAVTISAAAVDDVVGWILLAAVAALVKGSFSILGVVSMVISTLIFGAFVFFVLGPRVRRLVSSYKKDIPPIIFAFVLILVFISAIVTSKIGIFAIFGAFILGASLSPARDFTALINLKLRDFVNVFFLPIFFTYTGLRTRIDTLDSLEMWLICAAVVGVAVLGKFGGCGLAARLSGFNFKESVCIGTLMNTRALMELVVINIGKDLGVIPESVFAMLVIMALVTTVMTTPLLLYFMKGTELEPLVEKSGFLVANT